MIELEKVYGDDEATDRGELWSNVEQTHVISKEDGLYWARDENGEEGPFESLDRALEGAHAAWGDAVALSPALRLERDIEVEDENDVGTYLLEYLAEYGTAGIDAQALAVRVFERGEEG